MNQIHNFHYSPKTGNVARCSAESPETCRYGGGHASSLDPEEAAAMSRKNYEMVQADFTLVSFKRKGNKVARRFDIQEAHSK